MTVTSEHDYEFAKAEIEILRDKVSESFTVITQTERLCIGAAGLVAAFLITEMSAADKSAKIAIALIPILILALGMLRSISVGLIIRDMFNYIASAENEILANARLGFQRNHKSKYPERARLFNGISFLLRGTAIFSATALLLLIIYNIL